MIGSGGLAQPTFGSFSSAAKAGGTLPSLAQYGRIRRRKRAASAVGAQRSRRLGENKPGCSPDVGGVRPPQDKSHQPEAHCSGLAPVDPAKRITKSDLSMVEAANRFPRISLWKSVKRDPPPRVGHSRRRRQGGHASMRSMPPWLLQIQDGRRQSWPSITIDKGDDGEAVDARDSWQPEEGQRTMAMASSMARG